MSEMKPAMINTVWTNTLMKNILGFVNWRNSERNLKSKFEYLHLETRDQ